MVFSAFLASFFTVLFPYALSVDFLSVSVSPQRDKLKFQTPLKPLCC